jgi:hypothetical protein
MEGATARKRSSLQIRSAIRAAFQKHSERIAAADKRLADEIADALVGDDETEAFERRVVDLPPLPSVSPELEAKVNAKIVAGLKRRASSND